jgi:hypothetical protein
MTVTKLIGDRVSATLSLKGNEHLQINMGGKLLMIYPDPDGGDQLRLVVEGEKVIDHVATNRGKMVHIEVVDLADRH